jgi:hypothetical protein
MNFIEKLQSSGLDLVDAKLYGIKDGVFPIGNQPAMVLPYFDMEGYQTQDKSNGEVINYARYRFYNPPKDTSGKLVRYMQLPGTIPHVYFTKGVNWRMISKDYHQPIIITEGELKACKGCKSGFNVLGLGGVWSWRSQHDLVDLLDEIKQIDWYRRWTYLCFDSDWHDPKKNVAAALYELGAKLRDLGAIVFYVDLPTFGNAKVGLDDYLLNATPNDFKQLLLRAPSDDLIRKMLAYNKVYYVLEDTANIGFFGPQHKVVFQPINGFLSVRGADTAIVNESTKDKVKPVIKQVCREWLKWPQRNTASSISYEPGMPIDIDGTFNIWPGWGCNSEKGDISPFIKLLDFLFSTKTGLKQENTLSPSAAKKWFIQWLGYPIKHPGVKMNTCAVIWSPAQGIGKTLVGDTMGAIYGENFKAITNEDLTSSFTEWLQHRQFIMGDDIAGDDRANVVAKLKLLITQKTTTIDVKYGPRYTTSARANFYFTSNNPDAFFMSKGDRRFFVQRAPDTLPWGQAFYDDYHNWLYKKKGAEALRYYFENDVDYTGFSPDAAAPLTAAKTEMREITASAADDWIQEQIYACEAGGYREIYSAEYLFTVYIGDGSPGRFTSRGMARKLAANGCRRVGDGIRYSITDSQGNQKWVRLWALTNVDKWLIATKEEVESHLHSYKPLPNCSSASGF